MNTVKLIILTLITNLSGIQPYIIGLSLGYLIRIKEIILQKIISF